MVDFRISSGKKFYVDEAMFRKALPPYCFLLIVGSVRVLELEFLSGRIVVFKCRRSVKYIGVLL